MQGSYTKRPTSPLQQQPHSWTQLPGSQPPVCFLLCGRRPTRLPRQHRELLSKADAPHLSLLDSFLNWVTESRREAGGTAKPRCAGRAPDGLFATSGRTAATRGPLLCVPIRRHHGDPSVLPSHSQLEPPAGEQQESSQRGTRWIVPSPNDY